MSSHPSQADSIALARQLTNAVDKRLDILRRLDECGSISKAAQLSGVSYKAAWQAIETLENLAGSALVEKVVGGSKGGGTRLTESGRSVLQLAVRLARAREAVLREFAQSPDGAFAHIGMFGLQTSMRNMIPCRIESISYGAAMVRVALRIDGNNVLSANITRESAQLLDLKEGMSVLAMSKGTAAEVAANFPSEKSTHVLTGKLTRCNREDKGGEASVTLPNGVNVVGFCRPNHGLRPGDVVSVFLPPETVVIGLSH
ncbi:MAG: LysR family transcriptional regulator [Duodenibacillus sp.]|nr:LysR family transcriptional regulator [Duodenibacillus sp.]